ncbi:hypothetical protein GGI1_09023, partial [Acidithiobacillus sp. GGI-221]
KWSGPSEQFHESSIQFFLRQVHEHLAALQSIASMFPSHILPLTTFMDRLIPWIGAIHEAGPSEQTHGLAIR